jgi:hypothetical protein
VHVFPVVLVEMQQEKLPSMYSKVMRAAQDQSGLVIDDVTVKINREEEEETYGRGKYVYLSQTYVIQDLGNIVNAVTGFLL